MYIKQPGAGQQPRLFYTAKESMSHSSSPLMDGQPYMRVVCHACPSLLSANPDLHFSASPVSTPVIIRTLFTRNLLRVCRTIRPVSCSPGQSSNDLILWQHSITTPPNSSDSHAWQTVSFLFYASADGTPHRYLSPASSVHKRSARNRLLAHALEPFGHITILKRKVSVPSHKSFRRLRRSCASRSLVQRPPRDCSAPFSKRIPSRLAISCVRTPEMIIVAGLCHALAAPIHLLRFLC